MWNLALLATFALAAGPSGSLNTVTPSLITGTASDPDLAGNVEVHVYIDDVLFAPVAASGPGHSFSWAPPLLGQGSHAVVVYAIGVDSSGRPDGDNPSLAGCPAAIDGGCVGFTGDALAWCEGVPEYYQNRQRDTVFVGNNVVRVGVNTRFGGTVFQLYKAWDQTNLILEHGGGAHQLSIWGYDAVGPAAWFRVPKTHGQCDPTPYTSQALCAAGGAGCVERCCSKGAHVLNCRDEFPCGGWSAGAPWNPIQAMGAQCGWNSHEPATWEWQNANTTLYTSMASAYHFTSNSTPASLRMEQWVTVNATQPWATMEFRLTFAGSPDWGPTTQEIPAIFTSHGLDAVYFWYNGTAPWTQGAVTNATAPNSFIRIPGRPTYPHADHLGFAPEMWWCVCDAALSHCVTVASFSPLVAEAAVSNNSDGAYITPIGFFAVTGAMDTTWTTFVFPYHFAEVPPGSDVDVRAIIQRLHESS